MKTLVRDAAIVETFDAAERSLRDASILIDGGEITAIGPAVDMPPADRTIDARGCIVLPGFVNTHHHFYQTLTRAVPGTQDVELFDWLVALYPIWARLTPEALRSATVVACAELLRSGCTTASDHTYLWPNGCRIEDEVDAARGTGMRFHASRGSMSVGQSKGGLPPDSCVEAEPTILADTQRAIDKHHDRSRFAMTAIAGASAFE